MDQEHHQERPPILSDVPLQPSFVIAPGVELAENDDGEADAYPALEGAIVGQLGFGLPIFLRKNPLRAGKRTARDWEGLHGTTSEEVLGIIWSLKLETPPTTFGRRLRRAMLTRKITVDQLVSASGLGKTTIHRLLNLTDDPADAPKMDTIIALAQGLDVDGWWLETGEGEPPHGNNRSEDHKG